MSPIAMTVVALGSLVMLATEPAQADVQGISTAAEALGDSPEIRGMVSFAAGIILMLCAASVIFVVAQEAWWHRARRRQVAPPRDLEIGAARLVAGMAG